MTRFRHGPISSADTAHSYETCATGHMKAPREVRSQRSRDAPTGLAAFLGRVSGVSLIRRTIHRYEDSRRLGSHREERAALKASQQVDARVLALRLDLQAEEVGRRLGALEKVERRELVAFLRDERTDQRIRDRGGEDRLPSLAPLVEKRAGVERPA